MIYNNVMSKVYILLDIQYIFNIYICVSYLVLQKDQCENL